MGVGGDTSLEFTGGRCSSVLRAFAHGAMSRRIDPSRQWYFGQMLRFLKETIIPVPAPFDGAKAKLLNLKLVRSEM